MRLFKVGKKQKDWVAMSMHGDQLALAQGVRTGPRPRVVRHGLCALDISGRLPLERAARDFGLVKNRYVMLLKPGEYQVLLIEAPKVATAELRAAVRWSIKDLLDHPIDEVTLDILDIPELADDRNAIHQMYVIAAPNLIIQDRMAQFDGAKLLLDAIDIPETAQRNIAALYEEVGTSTAVLHVDDDGALLTIVHASNLYYTRRIDVTAGQLVTGDEQSRESAKERLLIELQRSLDHFERQYRTIPLAKLVIGPMLGDHELDAYMSEGLGISIETVDLRESIDFGVGSLDTSTQAQLFHAVGASLRESLEA